MLLAKTKKKPKTRSYRSPLREEQAAATRERILSALLAEAEAGVADVSVPALARRAKVSVATVYRHFPTRRALFEALVEQMDRDVGVPPPTTPAEIAPYVRAFFVRQDQMAARYRALGATALAWEVRREITVPRRRALVERMLAEVVPELEEPTRTWLADLIVVLVSTAMAGAMREYVGASGAAAADRVEWAIDALIARARATSTSAGEKKRGRKR